MPRTQWRWIADTPHGGGFAFLDAASIRVDSANLVYTRNALGDYSLNRTAAGAETYHVIAPFGDQNYRVLGTGTGFKNDTQNLFGGSSGPMSGGGRPPYAWGGSGQAPWLQPPTNQPPKGFQINDLWLVYTVGVAALTSVAMSLNITTFANNVVTVITNVPLTPPTIPLVAQVNPYVVVIPVTTSAMQNTDFSDVTAEATIVMATTGTLRVYGIGCHYSYNFA